MQPISIRYITDLFGYRLLSTVLLIGPDLLHLFLEWLQSELECGARVAYIELGQHAGVQDSKSTDFLILLDVKCTLQVMFDGRQGTSFLRSSAIVDRRRAAREERRVWTQVEITTTAKFRRMIDLPLLSLI